MTYDFDSETDQKVTIRHRDSTAQERVALAQIKDYFTQKGLILG
jgi:glycyl-tRNA synthetase